VDTVARRNTSTGKNQKTPSAAPSARRRVVVLVSLVAVLTFTSALLLAIAPAPLNPQATGSLLAVDTPQSFDELFDSPSVPIENKRWQYIYIHQSATPSGNAETIKGSDSMLADHFVIGNGDGCGDGEVQIGIRWKQQLAAGRTSGAQWILPSCISICLVGDFNEGRPTPTQQRQLVQLVTALQARLHVPGSRIFFDPKPATPAGIGAYFPARDFRDQVLP
jgi:hypothetical protein